MSKHEMMFIGIFETIKSMHNDMPIAIIADAALRSGCSLSVFHQEYP